MTDKKQPSFIDAKRRGFLQGAAVASGAVASGAAAAVSDMSEITPEVVKPITKNKGYEVTEHIKKYYARARF